MYQIIDINLFAKDVKASIKKLHQNQEIAAEKIGYSRKSLNKILNNPQHMSVGIFNALCELLHFQNLEKYIKTIIL